MLPKQIHFGSFTDMNTVNSPGARGFFEFLYFLKKNAFYRECFVSILEKVREV